MLVAAFVATVVLYHAPPLTGQFYFDIPAESAVYSVNEFMHVYDGHGLYPVDGLRGVRTNAVKGVFTPCEALRLMIEGTDVDVVVVDGPWEGARKRSCLKFPPPPVKPKIKPPRTVVDTERTCRCLEISQIPVPLCEDDRGALFFAHGACAP